MNIELTRQLFKKYPKMFIGKDKPITESLIPFGIECGDGWFWLIDKLCDCIQRYVDDNKERQVEAVQVKEKLGTLRFYVDSCDDTVFGMIWLAGAMSANICENCGSTVDITSSTGWIRYLCPKCMEENKGGGKF